MTKTVEKITEMVKTLPEDRQGELLVWLEDLQQQQTAPPLTPEQNAKVVRRMADPQPVYATDEQVSAVFSKFAG